MAWTTTKVDQHNEGGRCVQYWTLLTDSATAELVTGLGTITMVNMSPKSLSSGAIKLKINVLSAGTTANGTVAITGCTSGDELYLTVVGN